MTFYLLLASTIPFASDLPQVVDQCSDVKSIKAMVLRGQINHPNGRLTVTEPLFEVGAAMPAVPPELARAVEAWNLMCVRLKGRSAVPQVRAIANYVGPYRKWKKKNPERAYLLEDVVSAAERRIDLHHFLTFGWLLRIATDGSLRSDQIIHGHAFSKVPPRPVDSGEFEAEER